MKRFISLLLAMTMLSSVTCFNGISQVFAAEIIPVYLNGELLTFPASDAQPQIRQNRTYVPIRVTAEFLGMDIAWNSKTETMTFSRNGLTIDHTMRSNIVYVSGNALTFDTPSINVQNRTLMPIRMLGESIGGTVEWDNDKRCVYITTEDKAVADVSDCQVTDLIISKNSVEPGETIKLTATAKNATKVKFVDNATKSVLAESDNYTDNADGTRTFVANITADNETSNTVITSVYAYAGTDEGYNEDMSKIRQSVFVINPAKVDKDDDDDDDDKDYKSDYIVSCKLKDDEVDIDDYAYLTIVTTDEVEKVRVTNSFTSTRAEQTEYDEDDDERTFEVKTRMTKKGSGELYISCYLKDSGYEDCNETLKIKVIDDDDKDYDELEIVDVELVDSTVYKGEEANIIIYTSTDVEEVAIFDEDDDRVARTLYNSGKVDGTLVWNLSFEVKHSGQEKYTIIAYNEDNEEEKETIRIEGESYSKNDLVVLSVVQKTDSVKEGDRCKFEARTTSSADYIVVTNDRGSEIEKIEKGSGSSPKKFSFTIDIDDIDDYYYVYAYNDDGDRASKKFKVIAEATEDVEILSIEIEDKTVDEGDDVELTIYTTTNVEKLWIEDEDENRMVKKTKPTDKDDDEYVWEVDFEADDEGKRTYTIFVEDEDGNTDEYDFKITVKD